MEKRNILITVTDMKAIKLIGKFIQSMADAYEIANESCKDYMETEAYKIAQEYLVDLKKVAKEGYLSYSSALFLVKQGFKVSRKNWGWKGTNIYIQMQFPDENSKMSEPYIFMHKKMFDDGKNLIGDKKFPIPLSDESIFANDWFLVEE